MSDEMGAGAPRALAGLRVLDMSQGIAGPYCTLMMAAHGADVIKLEPPAGDWLRSSRAKARGQVPTAVVMNAGKRSLVLDLKDPASCAKARRIASQCDVIVENFRPGVVEKFGLDHGSLSREKPDIVYCSITGFGRQGPLKDRPVIDHVAQAYSGWMAAQPGPDGLPQRTPNVAVADQVTAMYAYQAIASALIRRFRFGQGSRLDVTLAGAMAAFLATRITSHVLSDGAMKTTGWLPPTGEFPTQDGLLVIAVMRFPELMNLFGALGRDDLAGDPRFATQGAVVENAAELREELLKTLRSKSAMAWEQQLAGRGVMACAVRDIGQFLDAQRADGLDLVEFIDTRHLGLCPMPSIPGAPRWSEQRATPQFPLVGEHTDEVLREFGLSGTSTDLTAQGAS